MPKNQRKGAARALTVVAVTGALLISSVTAAHSSPAADISTASHPVSAGGPATGSYPAPGQPITTPEPNGEDTADLPEARADGEIRVATLHADLTGDPQAADPVEQMTTALNGGTYAPARAVAKTAQITAPDVLVLTGVTYDSAEQISDTLRSQYLAVGQDGTPAVDYPYSFTAPTNSGRESGVDLDGDGVIGGPTDAVGYGEFPGQYGMVVFSKLPIKESDVRTFQNFRWADLPDHRMPESYSALERSILSLQETSFWDVPVEVPGESEAMHILATSMAPPSSASTDEARGADIRRVITDYVAGDSWYLTDDDGDSGGLDQGAQFVVAGAPAAHDEGSSDDLSSLLRDTVLQDPEPRTSSEVENTRDQDSEASVTRTENGQPHSRSSYVLPAAALEVNGSGVFWPAEGDYGYEVVDPDSALTLDDRLVWVDLTWGPENL